MLKRQPRLRLLSQKEPRANPLSAPQSTLPRRHWRLRFAAW
jgi:hypothetical protein